MKLVWGRSSIGLERCPVTAEVAGSSPVAPANLKKHNSLFCREIGIDALMLRDYNAGNEVVDHFHAPDPDAVCCVVHDGMQHRL